MLKLPNSISEPIAVSFLLVEQFSNLCLSNALEPLRAANGFSQSPAYQWTFYSLDGGPVSSSSGMSILPNAALDQMHRTDRLYVVSSYGHLKNDTRQMRRALQTAARQSKAVFGLDTGAWLMASAGLLEGKRATIHWDILDTFAERFLDVAVEQAFWIETGDRLTCAGASATLGLSRKLIAQDLGPAIAMDVDALFTPPAPITSPPGGRDPLLARTTRLMRAHIETPLPLDAVARALNTSPRTLARRCQSALGLTPGQLYRHIRLSAARQLVESTDISIAEIAVRCGYEDPTALTRAFRTRFGAAPRAFRGESSSKTT